MADRPRICLPCDRSTGTHARYLRYVFPMLPSDREWREPFVGTGASFAKVPADRPRYAADLDRRVVEMLIGIRDRPSIVIGDILAGWWIAPEMGRSREWTAWREGWIEWIEKLDPAASYWLRWRAGQGGRYIHPSVYRKVFNQADRGGIITRLWDFSDHLQGTTLRAGVSWEESLDLPGDAVYYLDPPGPIGFSNRDRGYHLPLSPEECHQIDWRALSDRLREEDRPWALTLLDSESTYAIRDLFLFAPTIQVLRSWHHGRVLYLISNQTP